MNRREDIVTDFYLFVRLQEFSRTVSTEEGRAFAASRDPPWMFAECSAKKGGDDVSGAEGIFGKVVDQVRLHSSFPYRFLPFPLSSLPFSLE